TKGAIEAPQWTQIATFTDASTGSQVVVTVRKAYAVTLPKLHGEVQRTYSDDKSFTVSNVVDLPVSGRRPLPGVRVSATQVRAPSAPAPGSPPRRYSASTFHTVGSAGAGEPRLRGGARGGSLGRHEVRPGARRRGEA